MTEPTCSTCHDTGMTRSGALDCCATGCTAASERADFNERLCIQGPSWALDVAWSAYRMGREDAKAATSTAE